jgi:quercetin dioxygenase-like cupin family protein
MFMGKATCQEIPADTLARNCFARWRGYIWEGNRMVRVISKPTRIPGHGEPPKIIDEFVGHVNSATETVSVAKMISPAGWTEPGQTPEFDEFTVVLRGMLVVETRGGKHRVEAGQAVIVERGEWVRYSTPEPGGAEYVAVCVPAFSPGTVHRDG